LVGEGAEEVEEVEEVEERVGDFKYIDLGFGDRVMVWRYLNI
jgi:hypothetical protein